DRRDGVDVVKAALEVDRDGAVELLLLDLEDTLGVRRAGIVQQEIDAAPLLRDILRDLMRAGEDGDIGLVGQRLAALGLDLAPGALHLGLEQVDQGDIVASCRELERAAPADAARSSCYDSDLAHAACSF